MPEVTPAHDSRHADSLTAKEKTLSLRKNGKKTDTDRMWEAWKGVGGEFFNDCEVFTPGFGST